MLAYQRGSQLLPPNFACWGEHVQPAFWNASRQDSQAFRKYRVKPRGTSYPIELQHKNMEETMSLRPVFPLAPPQSFDNNKTE